MINQQDLEDMATSIVMHSTGDTVPAAALPSLVNFMQEVGEVAARHLDAFGEFKSANKIRFHFGLPTTPAALLRKPVFGGGK